MYKHQQQSTDNDIYFVSHNVIQFEGTDMVQELLDPYEREGHINDIHLGY